MAESKRKRWQDWPLESREALRIAALLGDSFSLQRLFRLEARPEWLDPLFDSGALIEVDAKRARFADEATRAEALAGVSWSWKRVWSRRIAELLESDRGDPEETSQHWMAAQEFAKARRCLVRAAESACVANDYRRALALLRRAFELWPMDEDGGERRRVLREMARCAVNTGERGDASLAWTELLEMARTAESLREQIEAHRRLAELAAAGDLLERRSHLRRAAELSSELGEPTEESRQWWAYGAFLLDQLRTEESNAVFDRAIDAAERGGDPATRSEILAHAACARAMAGRVEEGLSLADRALEIADRQGLPEQWANAYHRRGVALEYGARYREYCDSQLKGIERCEASGAVEMGTVCMSCVTYAFFRLGEFKRSLDTSKSILAERSLEGEMLAGVTVVRACIAAFRGERRQAETLIDESWTLLRLYSSPVFEFYLHWASGLMAVFDRRPDAARDTFRSLIGLWHGVDPVKDVAPGLITAAGFYADEHNASALAECIDILNKTIAQINSTECKAALQAVFAEDYWMRGQIDSAVDSARAAIEAYGGLGLSLEVALIGRRLGLMLASADRGREAEIAWRRSEDIARDCGLRPLLELIAADRRRSGADRARDAEAEAAGLTPRQVETLRLVASGLSNKEAAARLGLSPRTVEMHMAGALERLNCRTRAEAIKRAAELGVV